MTQPQIQTLLAKHLHSALEEREQFRVAQPPQPLSEVDGEVLALDYLLRDTQTLLATCDYTRVASIVRNFLDEGGIRLDPTSPEFRAACREYLKIDTQHLRIERQRTVGDYSGDQTLPVAPPQSSLASTPTSTDKKLSELVDDYIAEARSNWSAKTEHSFKASFNVMLEVIGDMPSATFGFAAARQYKTALMKLPANRSKMRGLQGLSVEQLISGDYGPTLAVKTVNQHLSLMSQFNDWGVRQGYFDKSYAQGLLLKGTKSDKEQREVFSQADLSKIFNSETYQKRAFRESYQFWLPLLGLFTGARIEELCSLHCEDIVEEEGVLCLSINEQHDKKLKTKSAVRLIPLHPKLIELGFLDFVNHRRQRNNTRLFMELAKLRDGYSQTASKWFGRFKRRCGITEETRVFHSFRHGFATQLGNLLTPLPVTLQLMGHERGKSESEQRYMKDLPAGVVFPHLVALDFGIDLTHPKDKWLELPGCAVIRQKSK
ncbi:MAG: site-specific integrase [Sulfurimicrobium sp.]|nr:site-specific integrase [Sulfurimicrobium sp.]